MALGEGTGNSKRRQRDQAMLAAMLNELTEKMEGLKVLESEEKDSENRERDEHADCY